MPPAGLEPATLAKTNPNANHFDGFADNRNFPDFRDPENENNEYNEKIIKLIIFHFRFKFRVDTAITVSFLRLRLSSGVKNENNEKNNQLDYFYYFHF